MKELTMPNWCFNEVRVTADTEEELKEFVLFVEDMERDEQGFNRVFSFDRILPIPKELKNTVSPRYLATQKEMDEIYTTNDIDSAEYKYKIQKYITQENSDKLVEKYGSDNWYDWANENWGTKWDASNSDIYINDLENDDYFVEYQFETAWCPPRGIYNALNKRFPNIDISWFYREEGAQIAGYLPN
jgi:hypothetical protein|tara:strand:- start:366 stop:926 length:561 start_codon:yes stop_codon:yes gene_type:complete